LLPVVWPDFPTASDRWIGSEVLYDRPPPAVLDRGASLDDEGDRGGPTLGRLLEGVSRERARCVRGVPLPERSAEHRALRLAGCGKRRVFPKNEQVILTATLSNRIRVATPSGLVALKLFRLSAHDKADIIALIKIGRVDPSGFQIPPEKLVALDALISEAATDPHPP
jgi:hypothetical protein